MVASAELVIQFLRAQPQKGAVERGTPPRPLGHRSHKLFTRISDGDRNAESKKWPLIVVSHLRC